MRAITRIANADNEAHLVEMALAATAAFIEKIARKYRQVERLQAADQALALYVNRSLTYYWAEDGALVVNGRLTPEQGAVLIQAMERADGWIESSRDEPRAARNADALTALAERYLAVPPTSDAGASTADRFQIIVHVPAGTLLADGAIDPDDPPAIEDGPAIAPETVRRLACDVRIIPLLEAANAEALAIGRKTRTITPALRRAVKRRDAGCRFPGCTNTRFVDGHHIRHWADGGETRLDNLVTLYRHHHRLIHEGAFTVERTVRGAFLFYDPRGFVVPATAERRSRGNVQSLFDANVELGIEIDPQTTIPDWYGERPDYDHIVWVMHQHPADAELVT